MLKVLLNILLNILYTKPRLFAIGIFENKLKQKGNCAKYIIIQTANYTKCKFCIIEGSEKAPVYEGLRRLALLDYLKIDTAIVCNNDFSEENLKETIELFSKNGFSKFIFLCDFDFDIHNPIVAMRNLRALNKMLKLIQLPKHISVRSGFNFVLTEDLLDNRYLNKMIACQRSKQIFLRMPLFYESESINPILNHLLYKLKLTTVFTDFNKNLISCSRNYLDTYVLKPTAGIFALDFNYLFSSSPDVHNLIIKSIIQNISLAVSFSGELGYYTAMEKILNDFKSKESSDYCIDFFRHLYKSSILLK